MSELTPYLCVGDARAAMEWYADVLGAEVTVEPVVMDDGRIGHVEMAVDGAQWMMADPFPDIGVEAPDAERGAAVTLHLEVRDVDALSARVTSCGIALDRGPEDSPTVGWRCSETRLGTGGCSIREPREPSFTPDAAHR